MISWQLSLIILGTILYLNISYAVYRTAYIMLRELDELILMAILISFIMSILWYIAILVFMSEYISYSKESYLNQEINNFKTYFTHKLVYTCHTCGKFSLRNTCKKCRSELIKKRL